MWINCHVHVFNFKVMVTRGSEAILTNRLIDHHVPPMLAEATADVLALVIEGLEIRSPEHLALLLAERMVKHNRFTDARDAHPEQVPAEVGVLQLGVKFLLSLKQIYMAILAVIHFIDGDLFHWEESTLADYLDFVMIGLASDMNMVTDRLVSQLAPDELAIPLALDIISPDPSAEDQQIYRRQLDGTVAQIFRYPGRLLPFVSVNPNRPDTVELALEALQQRGFIGVKLYPSLGYDITAASLDTLYQYCNDHTVPITMHCNKGGFRNTESDILRANPNLWRPILTKYPILRVNLAHFGGDTALAAGSLPLPEEQDDDWSTAILQMIIDFPAQVYTDVACHELPMSGATAQTRYFNNLFTLLVDPRFGNNILWGTDYFLLRMCCTDVQFTENFQTHLAQTLFMKMAHVNAMRFLGFDEGGEHRENIENYVKFILDNQTKLARPPLDWVLEHPRCQEVIANAIPVG